MEKAEIKISELSVGDWVRVINQFNAQIDGYHSESGSLSLKTRQGNLVHYRLEDIHPIPLTPEVLEKSGFTHDKWSNKIWRYEDEESEVVYYIESSRLEITNDVCKMCITCKSVAELQHALRLAKVGKEIVL